MSDAFSNMFTALMSENLPKEKRKLAKQERRDKQQDKATKFIMSKDMELHLQRLAAHQSTCTLISCKTPQVFNDFCVTGKITAYTLSDLYDVPMDILMGIVTP